EAIVQWPAAGRSALFRELVQVDRAEGTGTQRRCRATDAHAQVIDSGESRADVLEAPGDRHARPLADVPPIRERAGQLDLGNAGQAIPRPDARYDVVIPQRVTRLQLGVVQGGGEREIHVVRRCRVDFQFHAGA